MTPSEVTVTNFPAWTLYVVAIAQIVFALAMGAIAFVLIKLIGQLSQILADVKNITTDVDRSVMPTVNATLKNVKAISDDARDTAHNVTGTVNRVSHVAGTIAGRMESPVVKTVGAVSGVVAGVKALRGGKKEVVVKHETTKRGGLFGRSK
ncbi:MAG: hypothetical protein M3347_11115 [Armatimonadota bacterium]|nr:hypothetical protein [Armatimonadota bacterium]